jgi:hypothetical protein
MTSLSIHAVSAKRKSPMPVAHTPSSLMSKAKGKEKAVETLDAPGEDGFERVLSRDEKRKQRKLDKHRPQFQFDVSYFRTGKKIGIAVSSVNGSHGL